MNGFGDNRVIKFGIIFMNVYWDRVACMNYLDFTKIYVHYNIK